MFKGISKTISCLMKQTTNITYYVNDECNYNIQQFTLTIQSSIQIFVNYQKFQAYKVSLRKNQILCVSFQPSLWMINNAFPRITT